MAILHLPCCLSSCLAFCLSVSSISFSLSLSLSHSIFLCLFLSLSLSVCFSLSLSRSRSSPHRPTHVNLQISPLFVACSSASSPFMCLTFSSCWRLSFSLLNLPVALLNLLVAKFTLFFTLTHICPASVLLHWPWDCSICFPTICVFIEQMEITCCQVGCLTFSHKVIEWSCHRY